MTGAARATRAAAAIASAPILIAPPSGGAAGAGRSWRLLALQDGKLARELVEQPRDGRAALDLGVDGLGGLRRDDGRELRRAPTHVRALEAHQLRELRLAEVARVDGRGDLLRAARRERVGHEALDDARHRRPLVVVQPAIETLLQRAADGLRHVEPDLVRHRSA